MTNQDALRIAGLPVYHPADEVDLRRWLVTCGVDLDVANERKGISRLWKKIHRGEASLVYDPESAKVFRLARVARVEVKVTLQGEIFPIFELCQIFLDQPITREELFTTDVAAAMRCLEGRTYRAHVRDSKYLWETLIGDEDAAAGGRRGIEEELHVSSADLEGVAFTIEPTVTEYEAPIDWPGIHSVLEIAPMKAVLPVPISRPVYVELEDNDQITIFVAGPKQPFVWGLFTAILPRIQVAKG